MISYRALRLSVMVLPLAALPCLIAPGIAHAQLSMGGPSGGGLAGGAGGGGDDAAAADAKAAAAANAPPPALPGAMPSDEDGPNSHARLDVNPTTALFDAIDHGDLTAAKDALSRGADMQATNVLGQNPIDMSIDLNRNAITFLLLSMRGNDDSPSGTQVATASTSAVGRVGRLAVHAHGAHEPDPVEKAAYAASPQALAGGVAKPEIGFLGFSGT